MIFTRYSYLQDSAFLQELTLKKNKTLLCKVTLLDINEEPIKTIEGRVQDGTLQVDGNSSIRRQGNISFVLGFEEKDNINIRQEIKTGTKIALEIGYVNQYQEAHPQYKEFPVFWFPQGVFIISNPTITTGISDYTIHFDLKDKMCLLNGIMGGSFPATITLGEFDTLDENGNIVTKPVSMYQLIKEMVHHWGGEQIGKIIVNDLKEYIAAPIYYNGDKTLFLFYNVEEDTYRYTTANNKQEKEQFIQAFVKGDYCGNGYTVFSYPESKSNDQGIFTVAAGSTVESALSNIKNKLGNYEFFYDIDGNFVFQEIKNYMQTNQATVTLNEAKALDIDLDSYLIDLSMGNNKYNFTNYPGISNFSEQENWDEIKNDFVLWGKKQVTEDIETAVRYHLAIDTKPDPGNTYECLFVFEEQKEIQSGTIILEYAKTFLTSLARATTDTDIASQIYNYQNTIDESMYDDYESYFGNLSAEDRNTFVNTTLPQWCESIDASHKLLFKQLEALQWAYNDYNEYLNSGEEEKEQGTHSVYTDITLVSYYQFETYESLESSGIKDTEYLFYVSPSTAPLGTGTFYRWGYDSEDGTYKYKPLELTETALFLKVETDDWRTELLLSDYHKDHDVFGLETSPYYEELKAEWMKYHEPILKSGDVYGLQIRPDFLKDSWEIDKDSNKLVRKTERIVDIYSINYFLDFIEGDNKLTQYNIQNIGRRLDSSVEEDTINCVFEPEIPEVILIDPALAQNSQRIANIKDICDEIGMPFTTNITTTDFSKDFIQIGGTPYNSAFYGIRNTLYQKTAMQKTLSLETLPIFYLEPNSRVRVVDDIAQIDDEYMIDNYSIPLSDSSSSSIELSIVIETL